MVKIGDRTLKLVVSQDWIDGGTEFLRTDANSRKLKVISLIFGWAWLFSSYDPKICCIMRMNLLIELIFLPADSEAIIFG